MIEGVVEEGRGFRIARKKLAQARFQKTGILKASGETTTNRDRIAERAKEFHKDLYFSNRRHGNQQRDYEIIHDIARFLPVTAREVENAINTMKKGKAPGPDNITIELLRDAGELIHQKPADLFTTCLRQCKIPMSGTTPS